MVGMRWVAVSALIGLGGCAAAQDVGQTLERALAMSPGEIAAPPPQGDEEQQGDEAASGTATQVAAPRLHVAQPGDTMASIAARYGFEAVTLERMNGLSPPYEVRPGDMIVLPNPAVLVGEPNRYRAPYPAPPSQGPAPGSREAAYVPPAPPPAARSRSRIGFYARPTAGPIVERFGAMANGGRLDGVELSAAPGTPIVAAADGVVVYAGDDVPAYGNLILVRHPDGGVTAYGYARTLNVREGARVRRGETIAEAGDRGRVYFQVRRGTAAVDPAPLIGD